MAKKLRSAARATQASRAPTPAFEPAAQADKGQVLRSLATSLRATATYTGGFDKVQRHVLNARRAERDGDLTGAARELRLACARAPERDDLRAEHARINASLSSSLAGSYEEQALYEQRHGKWAAAALSWGKVAAGRPDDPHAARSAAEALLEAKGDLHRARDFAQRAVDLAPNEIAGLRTLARVYIAAGLQLNARRVLQRAAVLDPNDEMVENLLRELHR
jgi:tetratricopeptide (TPR) repeat protein